MDEDELYTRMHFLYANIQFECTGSAMQPIPSAIMLPSTNDVLEFNFDVCMQEAARQINSRMGYTYVTVRFEGKRRWSLMGSKNSDYMEFQITGGPKSHTKSLKVTKHLLGASCVQCAIRGDSVEGLMVDLKRAMRTISELNMIPRI
jgi:hypothetical protein